jgi:hypothetical protein
MLVVRSRTGVPIRLTEERWRHIVHQQPEMNSQREESVGDAGRTEYDQDGDFGELLAVRLYPETPMGEKFVVVAYREINTEVRFILTAYLSRKPSATRETLWRR